MLSTSHGSQVAAHGKMKPPCVSRGIQSQLSENQADYSRAHCACQHGEQHPNDALNPLKRFRMLASDFQ
jgi:hypothetical protein